MNSSVRSRPPLRPTGAGGARSVRGARGLPGFRAVVSAVAVFGVALAAVLGLGPASPAGAHEGPGILTLESDTPTGTSHRYLVRLVWENDGHPAARATTITATPVTPAGAAQTPVAMTAVDDDGRFEATLDLVEPGSWKVRITSINPVATMEVPVDVAPPATTTTTAPATTTTGTPATTDDDQAVDTDQTAARDDDDSSGMGAGVIALVVLVVVALLASAYVFRSKMRPGSGPTDPGTTDAPDAGDKPIDD